MEFIGAHWMAIGWSRTIDHDQLVTDKGRFTNSNESGSPGTVGDQSAKLSASVLVCLAPVLIVALLYGPDSDICDFL